MDCLDENTVVAYVEGRLPAAAERRLLEHSDACETCRRLIAVTAKALVPSVSPIDATEPGQLVEAPPVLPGQRIGRYVVRDLIGAGGMGVVYEAHDPELERKVALKLLRTDAPSVSGTDLRQRLLREAQAMARIRHPNVITIYDVGTIGDQVFFAMELIEGATLAEWQRGETRSVAEVLRVFAAAGEGLRAAHGVGVVHRDFKPDNVLVGHDGRVFVTDFGLARPTARVGTGDEGGSEVATVTRAGAIVGTPAYMAPEQMRGETADARADQFSFCVALFEALYGMRPFPGRTLDELQQSILAGRRAPHGRRAVPARVRRALDRGLERAPDARFPSMAALLDELVSRRRVQLGLTLAIGALMLVIGVVGWQRMRAGNRAQLCKNAAQKMSDMWSPAHQADVQRAVEKAAGSDGWTRFKLALDQYTQRWIDMHDQACEATHVRGEQSEALLDLRMDCLEQRYQDARAFVEIVTSDPQAAQKALAGLRALPSIDPCANVTLLRRTNMPAIDAAKLEPVRARIARARAEIFADRCKEGLADAQAGQREAHTLGDLQDEALAQFRGADALVCLADRDRAQRSFLESAVVAAQAHDDLGVAHAYLALMQYASAEQKFDDAEHWSTLARDAVDHVGSDPELRAQYLHVACSLEYLRDRLDDAEPKCRQSLELRRNLATPNKYAQAWTVQRLGEIAGDRGRFAEAADLYREAQRLFIEAEGRDSKDALGVLDPLASDELEQDHLETALALEKRLLEATKGKSWADDAMSEEIFYGLLLNETGRPAEALTHLLGPRAALQKLEKPPPFLMAWAQANIGRAYLALGRQSEALPVLEKAWQQMPPEGNGFERSLLAIAFATALWEIPSERGRALEVAGSARDYLRKNQIGAYRKRKLAELEAWMQPRDESR